VSSAGQGRSAHMGQRRGEDLITSSARTSRRERVPSQTFDEQHHSGWSNLVRAGLLIGRLRMDSLIELPQASAPVLARCRLSHPPDSFMFH
jgi:hypothetical protein